MWHLLRLFFGVCLLWVLGLGFWVVAQQKTKSPTSIYTQIHQAKQKLVKIRQAQRVSLAELNLSQQTLELQEQLVAEIKSDLKQEELKIASHQARERLLEQKLSALKREYSEMIYQAAKKTQRLNRLGFILSAKSLNEGYRRLKYLQQYSQARRSQAQKMIALKQQIAQRRQEVQQVYQQQEKLLQAKLSAIDTLQILRAEQQSLQRSLQSQSQKLKQDLSIRRQQLAKLQKLKQDRSHKESLPTRPRKSVSRSIGKNHYQIGKAFVGQKGHLPSPLGWSVLVAKFGKQKHPVLKDIYLDNAGVILQSSPNASVKAIFSGEVSTVAEVPGIAGKVVILKHGDYLSVYVGLQTPRVAIGNWVKQGQVLAQLAKDAEKGYRLEFQIWHKNRKLNPSHWVKF